MSDDARAVWEQYTSTWKAPTREEKLRLFDGCLSPGCTYTDPLARTEGFDALVDYMLAFHDQIPGGHFVTRYFLAHHDRSIARWTMHDGGGTELGDGISYGEYGEDGKLLAMTGFFDTPDE